MQHKKFDVLALASAAVFAVGITAQLTYANFLDYVEGQIQGIICITLHPTDGWNGADDCVACCLLAQMHRSDGPTPASLDYGQGCINICHGQSPQGGGPVDE